MKNSFFEKLAIGTVQFGSNYGINNNSGKPSEKQVFEILDFAYKNNLNTLDTSYLYGNSEEVIGQYINKSKNKDFNIISKLPSLDFEKTELYFKKSISKLKVNSLYGYLIHHFNFFEKNEKIWEDLISLKNQNLVKKIGFSLYYPEEFEVLCKKNIKPDIIQIPFNIFDQRFAEILNNEEYSNIEFHIRSIFLQGLFFKKPNELSNHFFIIKDKLNKLNEIAEKYNRNIFSICFDFVSNYKNVKKIIVGFDNKNQLGDLIQNYKNNVEINVNMIDELINLKENNENIILPTKW